MMKRLKIIKSRNSKKDGQYNDRTSKYKMNNNDPRNSTQKLRTEQHQPH
jgi:hypothetical protein